MTEIADLSGVPADRIKRIIEGEVEWVSFDTCYHLSRALALGGGKKFVLLDLWWALKADRMDSVPTNNADVNNDRSAA